MEVQLDYVNNDMILKKKEVELIIDVLIDL